MIKTQAGLFTARTGGHAPPGRLPILPAPAAGASRLADFRALRTTYTTFVVELGASVKEAQRLLRHSTPILTMNVYARTRADRLQELAQQVGRIVEPAGETRAQEARAAGA